MRRSDLGHLPRRRPPRGSRGFSLLEALIVMGVLGIVAAIGLPSLLTQLARFQLESSATAVANLMRQTRMRAIRDNATYAVQITAGQIVGIGAFDSETVNLELEDPIAVYNLGDGAAVCLNSYGGDPTGGFAAQSVTYQGTGLATASGAICVHDNRGNVLQVAVKFPALPPVVRKYMPAGDSPSNAEGFFEKTSAVTADSVWVWYDDS